MQNQCVYYVKKEIAKLSETDWMSFPDSPTMTDAWRTYRQALRDLPSLCIEQN